MVDTMNTEIARMQKKLAESNLGFIFEEDQLDSTGTEGRLEKAFASAKQRGEAVPTVTEGLIFEEEDQFDSTEEEDQFDSTGTIGRLGKAFARANQRGEAVPPVTEGRLEKAFASAKQRGEAVLITYITAGYPTAQDTPAILLAMQEAGADIIELGVPYHNPIADGPTIQNCNKVAIQNGTNGVSDSLKLLLIAREKGLTIPTIMMGYFDGFEEHPGGIDQLCEEAAAHKADGFIAVGLPEDEDEIDFNQACHLNGLSNISIVLPDTTEDRIEELVDMTSSFMYVVSAKGPTGARDALPPGLDDIVARVRAKTNNPLAIGFGISTPEMVHDVGNLSDGAIVGSAITNQLNNMNAGTTIERAKIIRDHVAYLKTGSKQSIDPGPTNQATTFSKIPSRMIDEFSLLALPSRRSLMKSSMYVRESNLTPKFGGSSMSRSSFAFR